MDTILDTIDRALKRKGLSDSAASKLAVGHPALIKNLRMPREGEKRYNLPSLMRLADVLDLEFYFGPRRHPGFEGGLHLVANMDPSEDAPAGFVVIPWNNSGPGRGSAPFAFSRKWLEQNGLVPDYLQAIIPDTVALDPAPPAELVALLDTRIGSRKGHGLWCFRDAGRATIAHVTFQGDITVIHAAHTEDQPRVFDQESGVPVTLQGKVVWMGQTIPFKGAIK